MNWARRLGARASKPVARALLLGLAVSAGVTVLSRIGFYAGGPRDRQVSLLPITLEAKLLQADALEQMGYQAESGPWRNVYLMGAHELRHGVSPLLKSQPLNPDVAAAMTLDQYFDYMGLRFNAPKGERTTYLSADHDQLDLHRYQPVLRPGGAGRHRPVYRL